MAKVSACFRLLHSGACHTLSWVDVWPATTRRGYSRLSRLLFGTRVQRGDVETTFSDPLCSVQLHRRYVLRPSCAGGCIMQLHGWREHRATRGQRVHMRGQRFTPDLCGRPVLRRSSWVVVGPSFLFCCRVRIYAGACCKRYDNWN